MLLAHEFLALFQAIGLALDVDNGAAPNMAPPPAIRPRFVCTGPFLLVLVRSMCTPASAVILRTASLFGGPCGTSFPDPRSSSLSACRFGCPSILLLSFPDSLSGRFPVLLGVYLFSPPSPQTYIFSSAFSYILSLALTASCTTIFSTNSRSRMGASLSKLARWRVQSSLQQTRRTFGAQWN